MSRARSVLVAATRVAHVSIRGAFPMMVLGFGPLALTAHGAAPWAVCAGLPGPDLAAGLRPLPLDVTRPDLPLPEAPALSRTDVERGLLPLPGFPSAMIKPLPDVRDPGAFSCALAGVRGNETLVDCGVHRVMRGDLAGARQSLEQSVAGNRESSHGPTVALWLGEIAVREGRWDAAEQAYRTAMTGGAGSKTSRDAAIGLAWIGLGRGNWAGALDALAEGVPAATRASHDADVVRLLEGVALTVGDRPVEGVAALDMVEAGRLPGGLAVELPFWLGVALGRAGDRPRALAALDRFVASSPPDHSLRADAVLQAAWLVLDSGAPHEAVRRLQLIDPTGARPEVRSYLRAAMARAQLEIGDARRAREAVQQLVAASHGDRRAPQALLLVADAAVRLNRIPDGVAVYREVLRLPLSPSIEDYARYRLAEALERDGRLAEARQEYSQLRDGGRDEAIAQRAAYRLGLLALRANDPVGARQEGEALLRAGTASELREPVLLLSAEGAARDADAGRAAALFRAALRDYPESPRAAWSRLGLGWAHLSDGATELAVREWRPVLQGSDPETRTLAALAVAESALRERRDAEALDALRAVSGDSLPSSLSETVALDRGILAALAGAEEEALGVLGPLAPGLGDSLRQALARRALGVARYRLGQYDLAESELRQVVLIPAAAPSGWLGVGLSALAQGRPIEAAEALVRARDGGDPLTVVSADYGLVLTAIQEGEGTAFETRAAGFVDAYPAHEGVPALLCSLAMAAGAGGEPEKAEGWVNRLARDHPRSQYVGAALARFDATAQGQPAVRRRVYLAILAQPVAEEVRTDIWFALGEVALATGDAAGAQRATETFLREVRGQDPRIPAALARLARVHEVQGRQGLALRMADSLLARYPDDPLAPSVELIRGRLLVAQRQWQPALRALEAARDRGEPPVAAEAYYWLGEALGAQGDVDAALAAYLAATTRYPETTWAGRGLEGAARSYMARNMPREAAALLRQLAVHPAAEPALAEWARESLRRLGAEAPPAARPSVPTASAPKL